MPPQIVFIVPYRNRETQQQFYDKHMRYIMEDVPRESWEVLYIHQADNRSFNRGAIKNIGFLVVREKWPNEYRDMTLVFNDIDIMPIVKNLIQYQTVPNMVKHFYGFTNTLGGIVSIRGSDFERIMGFPNFWAWGYEDNMLQYRVLTSSGMVIDRSTYYPIYNKNFIMLHDGMAREVNRGEFDEYKKLTTEGYHSINGLKYTEDANSFPLGGSTIVHVHEFSTGRNENTSVRKVHDLRNGARPFEDVKKRHTRMGMFYQNTKK